MYKLLIALMNNYCRKNISCEILIDVESEKPFIDLEKYANKHNSSKDKPWIEYPTIMTELLDEMNIILKFIKMSNYKNIFLICEKISVNNEFLKQLKNISNETKTRIYLYSKNLSKSINEKDIENVKQYADFLLNVDKQNDKCELFIMNTLSISKIDFDVNHLV